MKESHEKALHKAGKHKHMEKEGKCKICGKVMNMENEEGKEEDDKGKYPKKEFGAKNNDSEEN